jgi:cytochrome c553/cytochrome c5
MKLTVGRRGKRAGLILSVLALGGFLVAVSGIIPITASGGHWAVTEWLLQFGKRRSVATHTMGMPPLELDDAWLVLKGAGHYETGCRPCHGSPDLKSPSLVRTMLPPPPYLGPRISRMEPEELFYIVKHGIKLTGMPAWPTQERDDEVRAVVAFLRALPRLDAGEYRRLVHGDAPSAQPPEPLRDLLEPAQVPDVIGESCARCHGLDGRGRGLAAFPKLAGQRPEYLLAALTAYGRGARPSGIMQPIAAGLTEEQRRAVVVYYSRLPAGAPSEDFDSSARASIDRGETIAAEGIPDRGVPSCRDCHGPSPWARNPVYPALAGQYADYLILQLELFRAGRRGGSPYAHLMDHVARRLSREQMRDVALYYASLPGAGPETGQ